MTVTASLLQRFDAFDNIEEQQLKAISNYLSLQKVPRGTFLIKRGKPLPSVIYLLAGNVDLVDASFNSVSISSDSERSREPLTRESPSDVSAKTKSDVQILRVAPEAFEIMDDWAEAQALSLAAAQPMEVEEVGGEDWMAHLLESPLFAQVSPSQLQQLFAAFEQVEMERNRVVVEEGAEGDYFYVIESGEAKVSTRFNGEVATLKAGQFFGEEALVGETVRNASVTMVEPGVVMRLNKEDFKALLQDPLFRFVEADEIQGWQDGGSHVQVLDVRLPLEYRLGSVKGSKNLPLANLRKQLRKLDSRVRYVVCDNAGKRSEVATHLLCQAGLDACILSGSENHYGS